MPKSTKPGHHQQLIPWNPNMKLKPLVTFKAKLTSPCRKLLILLKFKKPHYTRSTPSPRPSHLSKKPLFPIFRSHKNSKSMNKVKESKTISEPRRDKMISCAKNIVAGAVMDNVVEEACRSFEKYLLEMIVEEKNVKDLMDVEEMLYCWKNLKSPVFAELVSRFYGELCKDLFSPEDS